MVKHTLLSIDDTEVPTHPVVIVIGAGGQLGTALHRVIATQAASSTSVAEEDTFAWLFLSHAHFDILNTAQWANYLAHYPVYAIINCAAYTAVDRAEEEPHLAWAVNAEAVKNLVQACSHEYFIHISTDYLFGGTGNVPYLPDDVVHPLGVYAQSKRQGEVAVLSYTRGMVVRTGWLYSFTQSGFFNHVKRAALESRTMRVVYDQVGGPTWAGWLASMLVQVIEQKPQPGVWHMANAGAVSWFDFAYAINATLQGSAHIIPIRSSQYPTLAKRPAYSVLDCAHTYLHYGEDTLCHWTQALAHCIEQGA